MRYLLLVAFAAIMAMVSCSGNQTAPADNNDVAVLVDKGEVGKDSSTIIFIPDVDWTWDLIAGQNMLVGTVTVTNDEDTIYVTLNTNDDCPMSEAHVYAGGEQPDKGAPGKFPYKAEFDPEVNSYTFEIPLGDLEYKSDLYMAVHAVCGTETIWGGYWNDGNPSWDFGWGKKWGGGFVTRVMPMPELPEDTVTYRGYHFGTMSYWNIRFFDPVTLPPGSFFQGGIEYWAGWCVDRHHTMFSNKDYEVTLYSSYDQNLPAFAQNDNWDCINWMLTQRRNNGTGIWYQDWEDNTIKTQFQNAVWYFSDGIAVAPGSLAEQFVNEALANGDGFIPGSGEYYAIILFPDTSTNNNNIRAQMNIIEVDP